MKIGTIFLLILAAVFLLAAPAFAASLGVSPSHVEIEVPADGSATIDLQAYYFEGDVHIELVDIPLLVEPASIHVEALDGPVDVQLTFFGDPSLGSREYSGYIKFTGMSGEMIAIAVQVKAKITNLVEGQPVVQIQADTVEMTTTPPLESAEQQAEESVAVPASTTAHEDENGMLGNLSTNTVIIIAAGIVFVGLLVLSLTLLRRRRD